MNKTQQAYHAYAAIGELTIRKKQLLQQLQQIDQKLVDLENTIIRLSEQVVEDEKEGVSNVD